MTIHGLEMAIKLPWQKSATAPVAPADRFDGLQDTSTGRGGASDYVNRQTASVRSISYHEALNLYRAVGLVRNIINSVPRDCTREWFKISGVDPEVEKAINLRLQELDVREKITGIVRASRLCDRGSYLFFGVLADQPQGDLSQPLPAKIRRLDYLNLIEDGQEVSVNYKNTSDPTRADYGNPTFRVASGDVHKSRLHWIVDSWDIKTQRGVSLVEVILDSIIAQDASLWSVTQILKELSIAAFTSDVAAQMSPTKQAEFLTRLKNFTNSSSRMILSSKEKYERNIASVGGIKEILDFVIEMLCAAGQVPRSVAFGKAHGVMTAQEADNLNYYADVSRYQENDVRPLLVKIIDLIVSETQGLNMAGLEYRIEFNPLWKLDPKSKAEVDKLNEERDALAIDSGKMTPSEARDLDERLKSLAPFPPAVSSPPSSPPASTGSPVTPQPAGGR